MPTLNGVRTAGETVRQCFWWFSVAFGSALIAVVLVQYFRHVPQLDTTRAMLTWIVYALVVLDVVVLVVTAWRRRRPRTPGAHALRRG
jgi:uncharacterized membrane protein YhaH (DUF805 family)